MIIAAILRRSNSAACGVRSQWEARNRLLRIPHRPSPTYILRSAGPQTNLIGGVLPHAGQAYRIGDWAWELSDPPIDRLACVRNSAEIWTPSTFSRASLIQLGSRPIEGDHNGRYRVRAGRWHDGSGPYTGSEPGDPGEGLIIVYRVWRIQPPGAFNSGEIAGIGEGIAVKKHNNVGIRRNICHDVAFSAIDNRGITLSSLLRNFAQRLAHYRRASDCTDRYSAPHAIKPLSPHSDRSAYLMPDYETARPLLPSTTYGRNRDLSAPVYAFRPAVGRAVTCSYRK